MKNNEPLNVSSGKAASNQSVPDSAVGMTPEELRLYREILQSAYPKPKRDIKAGVMAAIRAEEADTVILPSRIAAKKKSRRDLFLKWGSLAASIVIVAGIGIRVLPAFLSKDMVTTESTSQTAAYDAALQETASAEIADTAAEPSHTYSAAGLYKTMLTDTKPAGTAIAEEAIAEEEIAEEAYELTAMSEEAPVEEAPVPEEAPAEEVFCEADWAAASPENVSPEEAVPEEAVDDMAYDACGTLTETEAEIPAVVCSHKGVFRDSYHEIPAYLIDEVGEDEYYAWANEISKDDSCAVNIYNFLHHFGISKTMFIMYLQNSDIAYYCDYPVDVLYEWEPEDIDGYYRDGGRYAEMAADYFEYEFKLALVKEIGVSSYTEWLGSFVSETVRAWSISQFVRDHGIMESRFLEIYDETAEAFLEEYEGCAIHSYDTAKVFVPSAEIQLAVSMSASGYQADVLCRK